MAAILRNVAFDEDTYKSFIDLQDKLHQNVCRMRSLVSIGTHDMDTISFPVHYDAREPKDIKFIALNQKQALTAEELLELFSVSFGIRTDRILTLNFLLDYASNRKTVI